MRCLANSIAGSATLRDALERTIEEAAGGCDLLGCEVVADPTVPYWEVRLRFPNGGSCGVRILPAQQPRHAGDEQRLLELGYTVIQSLDLSRG
jgi:hypothetical protein